jgi:hypothetical protein
LPTGPVKTLEKVKPGCEKDGYTSRHHSEFLPPLVIDYLKVQQQPFYGKAKRKIFAKGIAGACNIIIGCDDHKKYPAFADISEVGEMNRDNVAISGY